jgi:hypothetical protein
MRVALLILMMGCSRPDPCVQMCASAEDLYGGCLDDWDVGWTAAGYADGDDFVDTCETWSWEMRHLERDARRRGVAERGALDQTCTARDARFSADDATCDDFTDVDWSQTPW